MGRPPAAALHFQGAGTRCFHSVEEVVWYNRQNRNPTDHHDCPNDKDLATLVYKYEARAHHIHAPEKVHGYYEKTCRGYSCFCQSKECECSEGLDPLEACTLQAQ